MFAMVQILSNSTLVFVLVTTRVGPVVIFPDVQQHEQQIKIF